MSLTCKNLNWEELYKKHFLFVKGICKKMLNSEENAHEICHDVFLKAFLAQEQLKEENALREWLRKIAIRKCLDFRSKSRESLLEDSYLHDFILEDTKDSSEIYEISQMYEILYNLPLLERHLLRDYYLHEFTTEELSLRYGCTPAYLRKRLERARQSFENLLSSSRKIFLPLETSFQLQKKDYSLMENHPIGFFFFFCEEYFGKMFFVDCDEFASLHESVEGSSHFYVHGKEFILREALSYKILEKISERKDMNPTQIFYSYGRLWRNSAEDQIRLNCFHGFEMGGVCPKNKRFEKIESIKNIISKLCLIDLGSIVINDKEELFCLSIEILVPFKEGFLQIGDICFWNSSFTLKNNYLPYSFTCTIGLDRCSLVRENLLDLHSIYK